MAQFLWAKYGQAKTLLFDLYDPTDGQGETAAVHAAGDTVIAKDEAAEANTTNGFANEGGNVYSLALTATEMQAARIYVRIVDQSATKVWLDKIAIIETYGNASAEHAVDLDDAVRAGLTALPNANAGAAGGLPTDSTGKTSFNDLSAAQVNAEALDVVNTDTIAELAQAAPAATPTMRTALMALYMALRNKVDVTSTTKEFHNDAGTVVFKKALTDDGTTYSEAETVAGP